MICIKTRIYRQNQCLQIFNYNLISTKVSENHVLKLYKTINLIRNPLEINLNLVQYNLKGNYSPNSKSSNFPVIILNKRRHNSRFFFLLFNYFMDNQQMEINRFQYTSIIIIMNTTNFQFFHLLYFIFSHEKKKTIQQFFTNITQQFCTRATI